MGQRWPVALHVQLTYADAAFTSRNHTHSELPAQENVLEAAARRITFRLQEHTGGVGPGSPQHVCEGETG